MSDKKLLLPESSNLDLLRRHPVATAIIAIAAFVVWTLPIGIAQAWPAFVRDKTIPEWLEERRWPGMTAQLYGWLTIVFFLALLILLVVIIIISRRRETSPQPSTLPQAAPKTEIVVMGESERIKELERENDTLQWLYKIAKYQRNDLQKYVLVDKCEINLSPLTNGKSYFEFTFHVINYSIFYISIPMLEYDPVKGAIQFKGDPLSREAKLAENRVTALQPYGRNYFKVWQWVNQDEAKDIPATLEKVGNLFDFSKAIVYVRADKFPDDEVAKLDLTRGMQNAALENRIIQLEALQGQHAIEINE
jgi:uncharacterized membrane protein